MTFTVFQGHISMKQRNLSVSIMITSINLYSSFPVSAALTEIQGKSSSRKMKLKVFLLLTNAYPVEFKLCMPVRYIYIYIHNYRHDPEDNAWSNFSVYFRGDN